MFVKYVDPKTVYEPEPEPPQPSREYPKMLRFEKNGETIRAIVHSPAQEADANLKYGKKPEPVEEVAEAEEEKPKARKGK